MRLSRYANVHTGVGFLCIFESWHWPSLDPFSTLRLDACGGRGVNAHATALAKGTEADITLTGASIMGKYVPGWIPGVPLFVLVIIYLIFN